MKKKTLLAVITSGFLGISFLIPQPLSYADESVAELKKQVKELKAELDALKARNQSNTSSVQVDSSNPWVNSSASWNPFAEMQQMQDRMNRIFRDSFRRSGVQTRPSGISLSSFYEPDLDIQDNKDHYLMTVDLPGMDKEEINIEVTEHSIVISGKRNYSSEEQDDQQGIYRMERRFGSFSRRLPLPQDAIPDGVEAQYEKGVLEIKIAKKESNNQKEESKKIKVA